MAEKEPAAASRPYTADSVPNAQKPKEKKRFLKLLEERRLSKKCFIANPEVSAEPLALS
jgi:hypothetical protein